MSVLLKAEGLTKTFRTGRGRQVEAVKGVGFQIPKGKTYGLVGESGSGKSTVARMVAQLVLPTSGSIQLDGRDVGSPKGAELLAYRRDVQMIFQDPYGALNPRMTVQDLITEPFAVHRLYSGHERVARARQLLDDVGLPATALERKPVDFSGGQRQRIMIARALALQPRLIVADEPVSALDVSVQAQVLNLLKDLQDEHGLSYLFISHDLSVVEFVSDRIGIMHRGVLVEEGEKSEIYSNPKKDYTRSLISAIPSIEGIE